MKFIGDVHCKFEQYEKLIENCDQSIQVGDFGIGFPMYIPKEYNINHRFIRGNHDNPGVCRQHKNYLGEFGITDEGIFFISGGFSKDAALRIEGVDWWRDEELTFADTYHCADQYESLKPEIVVSHMCPRFIEANLFDFQKIPNKTNQFLQSLLEIHQPKIWIFGHYHSSRDEVINQTRFICLSELEAVEI